jgi:hypothetical protein
MNSRETFEITSITNLDITHKQKVCWLFLNKFSRLTVNKLSRDRKKQKGLEFFITLILSNGTVRYR